MGVRDSVPIREPLFARGLNDGRAAQNLTVQAICLVSQVLNVAIEIHLWPVRSSRPCPYLLHAEQANLAGAYSSRHR